MSREPGVPHRAFYARLGVKINEERIKTRWPGLPDHDPSPALEERGSSEVWWCAAGGICCEFLDLVHSYRESAVVGGSVVLSLQNDKRGGKTVKLSHPKSGWVTVYCHLSKFNVKAGQKVKRGDVIGLVGQTGRARAPHVHYEVRREGKRYNPWNFILDN